MTAADNTLGLLDVVNGGSGNDTLSITANVLAVDIAVPAIVLTSIETVRIRAVDGDGTVAAHAATFAVGSTAITTVEASGNSNTTVTALNAGSAVSMIGDGATKNGILSYAYTAATAAQTINISGGTLNTGVASITATASTGVTTVTINSTGAANAVDVIKLDSAAGNTVTSLTVKATTDLIATLTAGDFATTAAITVSGAAASVELGSAANVKTIDASGMTAGGLTITGGTHLQSFKGGVGNDVFTTAVYATPTTAMIAAGTGTDTLVLSSTTVMDTAGEAAYYTGFETLRVGGSQDMSILSGITALQTTATAAITQLNATQAAAVQVRADMGASSFALADSTGTADVLSLTMGTGAIDATPAATEATDFSAALTINGFETLNITTNAGSSAALPNTAAEKITTIASFVADKLTTINLLGQSVDLTNAATTKATTINAAALTGNGTVGLTIAGTLVAGSTVTGSAVADAITLGTVGSTYNTGAGDDAISGTGAQYRTTTTYNTIDGGSGTDTANITGGAALTIIDDDFKGLTNVEKITVATTTTNDQSITTGGWFDANFKAAGATLTTTSTDGNVTIAAGSFTGALTLVVTTADTAGSNAGIVTITTGSGNDTVTVSDTGSAAGTISTGAGTDTITGGAVVETITGGTGADVITGGGGADIYIYNAGDSNSTSTDSIIGYLTGGVIDHATVTVSANSSAVTSASGTAGLAGSGAAATFNAADSTLALRIVAIEAALASTTHTAGEAAHFQYGADTYAFITDGVAGVGANDIFIKLVGIDSTGGTFDVLTISGGNLTLA